MAIYMEVTPAVLRSFYKKLLITFYEGNVQMHSFHDFLIFSSNAVASQHYC
jgi:hypothetical protein